MYSLFQSPIVLCKNKLQCCSTFFFRLVELQFIQLAANRCVGCEQFFFCDEYIKQRLVTGIGKQ